MEGLLFFTSWFNLLVAVADLKVSIKQNFSCLAWALVIYEPLIVIFFFFADYWFTGRFEYHALMRRGVMERQRSFVFSMVFLMPHSHGIKNNEWSVKCVSLEITLSLSLLGKLFVVVDERECKDFSRVLHDHYLQNNLLIKGELADKNSNGAENKSLNIPSSGAWKADFQTYFYFFILFFLSSPPPLVIIDCFFRSWWQNLHGNLIQLKLTH